MTRAAQGTGAVCFSCGQPIGRVLSASSANVAPMPALAAPAPAPARAPAPMTAPIRAEPAPVPSAQAMSAQAMSAPSPQGLYPLTGAIPESSFVPPANPFAAPERAVLTGASGEYVVRAGTEIAVGRDPSQCAVVFSEPRVSGVHAKLKLDGVQLWARDESSNNGTFIDGSRVAPGEWTPVRSGAALRFGPVELTVRVE